MFCVSVYFTIGCIERFYNSFFKVKLRSFPAYSSIARLTIPMIQWTTIYVLAIYSGYWLKCRPLNVQLSLYKSVAES